MGDLVIALVEITAPQLSSVRPAESWRGARAILPTGPALPSRSAPTCCLFARWRTRGALDTISSRFEFLGWMTMLLDSSYDLVYAITVSTVFLCWLFFRVTCRLKGKRAVIREWDSWAARNPEEAKITGGKRFFQYLQQERPDLLDFRVGFYDNFDKGLVA